MTQLRIAKGLALPIDYVTKTAAIVAKRRVGKTYTGAVLAEELVDAGLPWYALDPTSAWWGLRSSASGARAGLPVVVIGGEHGDIPLDVAAGKAIAELVVEEPSWYVIDLGQIETHAETTRFATAFLDRIYRAKAKKRDPLHGFWDEADMFAPQRAGPDQTKMLGAAESIVRRGGIRGLGTTLITQRAAVLNKNVLTQVDILVLLRIVAPQDRDAVDEYVKGNATPEQRRELLDSLASLKLGEAWVYGPGEDPELYERVRIRERRTFNSSATPKPGEQRVEPKKFADVDLEALRTRMATTIEKAKAEDPAHLRRQLAELQRKLRDADQAAEYSANARYREGFEAGRAAAPAPETVEVSPPGMRHALTALAGELERQAVAMRDVAGELPDQEGHAQPPPARTEYSVPSTPPAPAPPSPPPARPAPTPAPTAETNGDVTVSALGRQMLEGLAAFPDGLKSSQLAALVGKKASGGYFRNTLSALRTGGLVVGGNELVRVTQPGLDYLGGPPPALTRAEVLERWRNSSKMTGLAWRIQMVLVERYPDAVALDDLAAAVPKDDGTPVEKTGGYFRNSLSFLRSNGLAEGRDPVKAADSLFLLPA